LNRPSGARQVWRFAGCEFDEARWRLTVGGATVELETKPLELLLEFLRHAGEVLTKDELMDAVWPATNVVEGSLPTAISKLRKALNDEDQTLIATVPRIGYRLTAAVDAAPAPTGSAPAIDLKTGQLVPRRPQWRLVEALGVSHVNEVWLAQHVKTGERRVFKFASGPAFLRYLKREATLSRLLQASLGDRPDFAPVLEWNFETAPFFIEAVYRGPNLLAWAEEQGGLRAVPPATRLELAIQICDTVTAAHGLGVLHRDLKPANIIVSPTSDGGWRAAVVDFGSADLTEPDRLAALAITNIGFESAALDSANPAGTAHYLPPEQHAGAPASIAGDIFALGVILYQLVVGDFSRPLSPGWEQGVADPLLREDIAAAAAGDPARRLVSAADLAARLRALDSRREARARAQAEAVRKAALERELLRGRARRPWAILAGVVLVAGVVVSSALYLNARRDRDEARRQTAIAQNIAAFLSNDLLARSSPFRSGKPDESLLAAINQAATRIDPRFRGEPRIAAQLHQTIAQALDKRSDWVDARAEYDRAAQAWRRAEGDGSPHARIVRLQQAMMEARSYGRGSLDRARRLLAAQAPAIEVLKPVPPDLAVWLASARGMVALIDNDVRPAAIQFARAVRGADAHPDLFDAGQRLTFRQRLAFTHIRLGEGAQAEALFRELVNGYADLEGADAADVLMVRMNLVQALMVEGRHAEAVAEADALYPRLLAVLGPEHEMTLQLLSTRAQSEASLERWDAAIADTARVHAIAVRKQGPASFFSLVSLADGATAKCRSGRHAEALADLAKAHEIAHRAFPGSGLQGGIDYAWGECLISEGRFEQAARTMKGIDRAAVTQLAADSGWGANLDLANAQIAYARHDLALARRDLEAAAPIFSKPHADPYQARAFKRLEAQIAAASAASS
jgi:DNA-binding winged helix-turn-helix (wHTH) protein/serine/threonine protein kinase